MVLDGWGRLRLLLCRPCCGIPIKPCWRSNPAQSPGCYYPYPHTIPFGHPQTKDQTIAALTQQLEELHAAVA